MSVKRVGRAVTFDAVAREFSAPLLRYLVRQVGDATVAEDLRQEALLRVQCGLAEFGGRSSLKTWVFAIATNVAMDYLRMPANRQQIVDIEEAAGVADGEAPIDEQLVIDEMNHCLRGVIDSLPANYRAALILHDLEGMTGEQTAGIIGCSLSAVKVRIHRARARLQRALQQQCSFYHDNDSVLRCTRN